MNFLQTFVLGDKMCDAQVSFLVGLLRTCRENAAGRFSASSLKCIQRIVLDNKGLV